MDKIDEIWEKLVANDFKVSTDTRKDVHGTVFFAIRGENFDGKDFAQDALAKGAVSVVMENSLEVLQKVARRYRDSFNSPIIAIGGSNGKTTTRELTRHVLQTRYKVHASESNLNNHIGVPLSILSMPKSTEIGIFEIGANHLGEHTELLEILNPTHVLVTNDGLDHLEGFGSPEGVRKANEEILTWAKEHKAHVITRSDHGLQITSPLPLTISRKDREYKTSLVGDYNLENINWALSVGKEFQIDEEKALEAVEKYVPTLQRSQLVVKGGNKFILDCYNANPTSMRLALESFFKSAQSPRGVILGDMLELGSYAEAEHEKILDFVSTQEIDRVILIGEYFKKSLEKNNLKNMWFPNADEAKKWFDTQNFTNHTFLLKGSRGIKVEKVLGL